MTTFSDAYTALRTNSGLQFAFLANPVHPSSGFDWNFSLGSGGTFIVYAFAVLILVVILACVIRALRNRVSNASKTAGPSLDDVPIVSRTRAQTALADADALAASGRFLDASHVLLACGIEAIGRHDPALIRPAYTSRDILNLARIPLATRSAFGTIALTVEIGLFGGRSIGAAGYNECRSTFVGSTLAHPP